MVVAVVVHEVGETVINGRPNINAERVDKHCTDSGHWASDAFVNGTYPYDPSNAAGWTNYAQCLQMDAETLKVQNSVSTIKCTLLVLKFC